MIRFSTLILFSLLMTSTVFAQGVAPQEILVRFKTNVSDWEINDFINSVNGEVLGATPITQIYRIKVPTGVFDNGNNNGVFDPTNNNFSHTAVDDLSLNPYIHQYASAPASVNVNPYDYHPLAMISSYPYGLDFQMGTRKVKVAILDSGVDPSHEVFDDYLSVLWGSDDDNTSSDFFSSNGQQSDTWFDHLGHGTNVAGIVAATFYANNSSALDLRSYKVVNDAGVGTLFALLEGIEVAIKDGAEIINISLGYLPDAAHFTTEMLESVLNLSATFNVLFICSAGNSNLDIDQSPYYPASLQPNGNHLIIGATNESGEIASWSNFGNSNVTFLAPGENILYPALHNSWSYGSGTSYATPIVSALAASLSSQHQGWNLSKLMCQLTQMTSAENSTTPHAQFGIVDTDQPTNCENVFKSLSAHESGAGNLSVYPNPTTGHLTIKANQNMDDGIISVFDFAGKHIVTISCSGKESNSLNIDLGRYVKEKGVYNIRFVSDNFAQTKKVIFR